MAGWPFQRALEIGFAHQTGYNLIIAMPRASGFFTFSLIFNFLSSTLDPIWLKGVQKFFTSGM